MNRHDDSDAAPVTHARAGEQATPWPEMAGYGALIPSPATAANPKPTDYTSWLTSTELPGPVEDITDGLDGDAQPAALAAPAGELRRGGLRWWWGVAAVAAVMAGVAAVFVETIPAPQPAAAPVVVSSAAASTSPVMSSSSALVRCVNTSSAERVSGNGPGSTESGPQAILALEHAYYVTRRASAVRALLAADGPFGADAEIQAGIDAVPAGTTHCVEITAAGPDRWAVVVSEHRPDGTDIAHRQTILTITGEGRTLIRAVEAA